MRCAGSYWEIQSRRVPPGSGFPGSDPPWIGPPWIGPPWIGPLPGSGPPWKPAPLTPASYPVVYSLIYSVVYTVVYRVVQDRAALDRASLDPAPWIGPGVEGSNRIFKIAVVFQQDTLRVPKSEGCQNRSSPGVKSVLSTCKKWTSRAGCQILKARLTDALTTFALDLEPCGDNAHITMPSTR